MGRDLTPYMLAGGPILLMVAFFSWPQTSEVGSDATDILFAEDRMPLMVMLAVATIGIVVMFGGLYLLVQQMKKSAGEMHQQMLTVAGMCIIAALALFMAGVGGNVNSINAIDIDIDADDDLAWESEADQLVSVRGSWDAANSGWAMMPVMLGMGMILVGMTAFMMQRPSGTDYMWTALMPVGLGFSMAPILNNPSYFDMIFPVTMLVHIVIGVMMITGNLNAPGSTEAAE
ncbi:MAG TPA: hypothetical protein HA354_02790 [Candidatus Poseidoniaceae archaeon]|nr:MAG TPA: hypothetical protein D7I07_02770 [Candidatus Poseidoniales archaeon]HII37408.1 hypothetical protein [Candidatus Poseidoniaceae archaeon]